MSDKNYKEEILPFIRKKEFKFKGVLGKGAFGKTVLLEDPITKHKFVCKKYIRDNKPDAENFYKRFVYEIKLLFNMYHKNIVRFFNCYLYPEKYSGYIIMEYIEGEVLSDYLKNNKDKINSLFYQTIEGFKYIEDNNILHRDIRPNNIMVNKKGQIKIIDFGFGKKIDTDEDFNHSMVTLNKWCQDPIEFKEKYYDFKTEVYFIGQLFFYLLNNLSINNFKYQTILKKMINRDPENRISSFKNILNELNDEDFKSKKFNDKEIDVYRQFSNSLINMIAEIEENAEYIDSVNLIITKLEQLYHDVMLEKYVPVNDKLIDCFIDGYFKYYSYNLMESEILFKFIKLFKNSSNDKKHIIVNNFQAKLNTVERFFDVPF